ncbi:MAG TPA: AAA family ATPase, partial [Coriobacteriia bacterium]|nr:AAA family ATPase [Coriobacteriia bacterium]
MTIEEEIVAWALRRPAWQQEVLTALARGEVFDEKRVPELADRLLDPVSTQASNEAKTLSLRSAALKRVRLVRVCNLRGVNALAESQTLSFAPEGLTVIFGGNDSGKSGYARLIKALANARHPAKVLPDVFRVNPAEPSAELVYQVDGQEISQKFPCPEGVPDLLQMRFFDEHCGDEYLTKTSVIDYRPSALALLDRLIEVCDRTRDALASRIAANEAKHLALDLPPETTAGAFVTNLTYQTTDKEIDEATTLAPGVTEAFAAALQELARLQASDAVKERARLRSASLGATWIQERLAELTESLSNSKLTAIKTLRASVASQRAAA